MCLPERAWAQFPGSTACLFRGRGATRVVMMMCASSVKRILRKALPEGFVVQKQPGP